MRPGNKECVPKMCVGGKKGNFLNVYDYTKAHSDKERECVHSQELCAAGLRLGFATTARKIRQRQKMCAARKMRATFSEMVFFLTFRLKILTDGSPRQFCLVKCNFTMKSDSFRPNQCSSSYLDFNLNLISNNLIQKCAKMIKAINQIQFTG